VARNTGVQRPVPMDTPFLFAKAHGGTGKWSKECKRLGLNCPHVLAATRQSGEDPS
jgi:hypothetical protein